MKVQNAVANLNGIDEVLQVLLSANDDGIHISYETVALIRRLLMDYQGYILNMEVIEH